MRIVLVYQHFMVRGAGSDKPYDLARHLASRGHDVTVICGRGFLSQGVDIPKGRVVRMEIDGIHVVCLGVAYGQHMGFVRRLLSFLAFTFLTMLVTCRMPLYDVMLVSSTPLTIGLVGLISSYIRHRPWVFEIRDLWPECPFANGYLKSRMLFRIATWFEEWFYRKAYCVCAISEMMIDRLVERGFPRGRLHFIPTGVDVSKFDVPPDEQFLRENRLEGLWLATYVGAFGRVNGLDYLLEAAEHLRDLPGVRLVLVGDGSERQRLVAEAARRGLTGSPVVFVPAVPKERIPGILRASHAVLMMNQDRPGMKILMPNKFFDYLAAGRPLLVNLEAEVTTWIRRADCGVCLAPNDPATMKEALALLRNDPARAQRMAANARRLAEEHFDRKVLNVQWEQVLQEAAASQAR